jgi:hypothetical protein
MDWYGWLYYRVAALISLRSFTFVLALAKSPLIGRNDSPFRSGGPRSDLHRYWIASPMLSRIRLPISLKRMEPMSTGIRVSLGFHTSILESATMENVLLVFSAIAANQLRNLTIEENALPDLEIEKTPKSLAMIVRTFAVLGEHSFHSLPPE